jgi:hypothetical protein
MKENVKEDTKEEMKDEVKEEMKEEIKEEKMEDTRIKEKAQRMEPTPGELMVLRAIRNGATTRVKIQKNFGGGIAKEIIDDFVNMTARDNFVIISKGRYFLSPKGVDAVLKHELERSPKFPAKTKEVVADKIVGGIIIALGLFILIIGFQFALGIVNTPIPEITPPSTEISEFPQMISYYMEIMCEVYMPVMLQFIGTLLIIYIGGSVLSKGVTLFRR